MTSHVALNIFELYWWEAAYWVFQGANIQQTA